MWQPVTSDAHEVFHQHGFKQRVGLLRRRGHRRQAEAWPVRDGRLDSVGIDTTPGSGGGGAPYRVIADTEAQPAYDLMSYCGLVVGDPQHWISVRNWDSGSCNVTPPPPDNRPWLRNTLVVRAQFVREASWPPSILAVASAQGPPPPDPGPSPYVLVASGIAGADASPGRGQPLRRYRAPPARIPSTRWRRACRPPGSAKVEVQDAGGGVVVASRTASRAAPRARILRACPLVKSVGGPKGVVVRWKATDADDDPLKVTLDYALVRRRSLCSTTCGPARTDRRTARLRTELLTASRRARLRLRVSDGFRETTTTSCALRRGGAASAREDPRARPRAGGADDRGRGAAARRGGRRARDDGSSGGASCGARAARFSVAGRPSTARCPRARGGSASRRPTGTGGPRRPPASDCACARRPRSSSTSGRARCAARPARPC